MNLELEVTCELCGEKHRVMLNKDGRYRGPVECDERKDFVLTFQVDPALWKRLTAALAPQEAVH